MSDYVPKTELLRSLGRLVRGLSALFWGLPIALFVCVKIATVEWTKPLFIFVPVGATALLFYGLALLSHFQQQERVWRLALDRAKLVAVVNIGLSPFCFWWGQLPSILFYNIAVGMLLVSGVLFIFNLNLVLQRLAAMLPDETLRSETRIFGNLNRILLLLVLGGLAGYLVLLQITNLPDLLIRVMLAVTFAKPLVLGLFAVLILLPLAMTMTLIWKIKEAVFSSVFGAE